MPSPTRPRVAVVGGGIAGLVCAERLAAAGAAVTVLDKGRAPGGRISTRRAGALQFDHGAQYFTARDPDFVALVERWRAAGHVAEWTGPVRVVEQGTVRDSSGGTRRWVGKPSMSRVAAALTEAAGEAGAEVHTGVRVADIARTGNRWQLASESGASLGAFHGVVAALPAPQAAVLLAPAAPELAERCAAVTLLPCWSAMVAFETPLPLPYDGAFVHGAPLSWVARDTSKPGRPAREAETWVLHAGPDWSRAHLEAAPQAIAPALLAAFAVATGIDVPPPSYLAAHRWRYALPEEPLEERALWDRALRLGACGDWCGGPRVEGAWQSGRAMAERVVEEWG